uniref:Uncharacterized protein n=1 Tax=Glossina pallidipes TaxID=7398 RepID=A0A1A9Z5T1_GLOPL
METTKSSVGRTDLSFTHLGGDHIENIAAVDMDKIVSIMGPDDNNIVTATHKISKPSNDNSSAKEQEFLFLAALLSITRILGTVKRVECGPRSPERHSIRCKIKTSSVFSTISRMMKLNDTGRFSEHAIAKDHNLFYMP